MSKVKQVRESKEKHQKWAKEASTKRFKGFREKKTTFGETFDQILAAGEPVEGLSIGYRVSKRAIDRLITTTQGKERI